MTMQAHQGPTTLANLSEALNYTVASARTTREYVGEVSKLCEKHTLKRGTGTAWIEPQFDKLYAQEIPSQGYLRNPQQQRIVRVLSITPRAIAVQKMITDDIRPHLAPPAWAKMGVQAQEAMTRKRDVDGLIAFEAASTDVLGTNGSSFDYNLLRAASDRMTGNQDEPVSGPMYCVAHRYQITDIDDALVPDAGGVNNANRPAAFGEISTGLTAQVFRSKFRGKISDVMVYEDDHIDVSGNNAMAAVFARESIVRIDDEIMTSEMVREADYGEGAMRMILRDKYGFGLRRPDLWTYLIRSDATEPV